MTAVTLQSCSVGVVASQPCGVMMDTSQLCGVAGGCSVVALLCGRAVVATSWLHYGGNGCCSVLWWLW